jgi:hypothetical protein
VCVIPEAGYGRWCSLARSLKLLRTSNKTTVRARDDLVLRKEEEEEEEEKRSQICDFIDLK